MRSEETATTLERGPNGELNSPHAEKLAKVSSTARECISTWKHFDSNAKEVNRNDLFQNTLSALISPSIVTFVVNARLRRSRSYGGAVKDSTVPWVQ